MTLTTCNYYDGKKDHGVIYDWGLIQEEYDLLGVPEGYYYPCFNQLADNVKIVHSLSIRSTGKTTSWLLVGLCMHRLYGTVIQYIRTTSDELTPSWSSKLVEVIRTYNNGQYIKQLTDNKYNDIYYHWKQFFYCLRDEDGNIVEKSTTPIIQCLAVSEEENYKSTYNTFNEMGDFFLYDEYITKSYYPNCFFHTFNLFKTCARERRSPVLVFSANTTNLFSPWFEEFGISKEVKYMKQGDSKQITTRKGTRMYVEYIALVSEVRKKNREVVNRLYFGFDNPKLASITGEDNWSFDYYPHIPPRTYNDKLEELVRNLYLKYSGEFLRIVICTDSIRGLHARVVKATKTYDDSIILTQCIEEVQNSANYIYGFGYSRKIKKLWKKLIDERRVYFSTNEVGAMFTEYFNKYQRDTL